MTGATPNHDFIAGFQRGNFRAISNLYNLYYSDLLNFAVQLTEDPQEANDIIVDTFTKLIQRRDQFDSMPNIKAFLYITIRNLSLDYLKYAKQAGVTKEVFEISPNGLHVGMDEDKVQPKVIGEIQAETDQLPAEYQHVFKGLFVNGSTVPKIAEELGITPRTVLQYKSKALHLLQEGLSKKGLLSIPILIYFLAIVCPEQKKVGVN